MYAMGQHKELSRLIEPALHDLIRGKKIPWRWFEEIMEAQDVETRPVEIPAAVEEAAVEAVPIPESLTSLDGEIAPPDEGRGEKGRKSPAEVIERIRRRKVG